MKLEIKEPCHEDWEQMKIGLVSRHCDVCDKGVMDFTTMNRAEIITYILSNPNDEVCGRMRRDQFDFHHEDIPILIEELKKRKTQNPFLVLALVCLSLTACAQEQEGAINVPPAIEVVQPPDSLAVKDSLDIVDSLGKVSCEPENVSIEELGEVQTVIQGDIDVPVAGGIGIVQEPVSETSDDKVYQFAEKMPEYPGGMDALFTFVKSQLKYPEYERNNNIQGNVYVRFVVEKEGSITRLEILRSVPGSKNFDAEVKRIIQQMPAWIPGENAGTKVPVYMTLPIRFNLK